jgi:hypothetical protein
MTFTAVGTIIAGTGAFTLTPGGSGDVIALFAWSSGAAVTALSSANVNNGSPWTVAVPGQAVGSETVTAFLGTVTATGGQTLTPTVSGSPTLRLGGQELHSSIGASSVALYGSPAVLDATGTAWPSLTALPGQCYIGFEFNGGSATGGSTTGFVYQEDANGNGLAYRLSTAAGANSPVWGDSDPRDVLALLLYEAAAPPGPRLVPPGITSPMAFRRHAWPSMAPPLVAVPDTGSGADSGSVTAASIASADTGSAAEGATAQPGASDTDTGHGTEAGSVTSASISSADTGSGADAGTSTFNVSSADTGSGAESAAVTVRPLLTVRWDAPDKLSRSGGTMGA